MPESSVTLHEPSAVLPSETIELHRAIVSLMEELEAVDWYGQRLEACGDDELRAILDHNRREEIEHASMLVAWISRHDPNFRHQLAHYLDRGETAPSGDDTDDMAPSDLALGDLRKVEVE